MDGAMMGTMVGAVLGFLGAVLPKVFELISAYMLHRQQHETQAQQIDAATKGVTVDKASTRDASVTVSVAPVEGEVPAPGIPPDLSNTSSLNTEVMMDPTAVGDAADSETPDDPTSTFWIKLFNTLRYSVRPVITYGFFVLFLVIKLQGLFHGMIEDHTPIVQLLPVIWDEGTESLFAAILAFWFGSRAFEKTKALREKP